MESWPTLSVVIPHYGDPGPTQSLCDALAQQVYESSVQVVVVDDCSPHAMPDVGGVEVVRRDRNGGFGAAVNSGARVSTGELLLVLNSDVTLPEGFLADLVAAAGPFQPGIFGPLVGTGTGWEDSARTFPTALSLAVERLGILARHRWRPVLQRAVGLDPLVMERALVGGVHPAEWLVGIALLLPREAFLLVAGFDERFHMYSEEVDLQIRLRRVGVGAYLVGDVALTHVGGASSDPVRVERWLMDSRMKYAEKLGWRRLLHAELTLVAGVNFVTASLRRLLGRDTTPLRDLQHEIRLIRRSSTEAKGAP